MFNPSRGNNNGGFEQREYEFSCSSSSSNPETKRKHYLSCSCILRCLCIRPQTVEDGKEEFSALVPPPLNCNGSFSRRSTSSSSGEVNNGHEVDRRATKYINKMHNFWSWEKQMSRRRRQEMLDRGISWAVEHEKVQHQANVMCINGENQIYKASLRTVFSYFILQQKQCTGNFLPVHSFDSLCNFAYDRFSVRKNKYTKLVLVCT